MRKFFHLLFFIGFPFLAACGGGGGSDNETPAPLPGVFTLRTVGGAGGINGGTGGDGGAVLVLKDGGTGSVEVLRTGQADASFTFSSAAVQLGNHSLILGANESVTVLYPAVEPLDAGTPYLLGNTANFNLRLSDGDGNPGNDPVVTGISIAEGATLTFGLNDPGAIDGPSAHVILSADIDNRGTITTVNAGPLHRGHLLIELGSYSGTGTIDTSGTMEGQDGGNVFLWATGNIINHGPIRTRGAASASGDAGYGGNVEFYAGGRAENTADINAAGGNATGSSGSGGDGGYIDLNGDGGMSNSGSLVSTGGSGSSEGGWGGWVWLEAGMAGDVRSGGAIDSSGGNSSGGSGGEAGDVDLVAYGGSLSHNAAISARGGHGGGNGLGGDGGWLYLEVYPGGDLPASAPGSLQVSGDLDSSGGSGAGSGSGGFGGPVEIYLSNADSATLQGIEGNQLLRLFGYARIETRGGDGVTGGSGGTVELVSEYGASNPAGTVNQVEILSRGGNAFEGGSTGHGGMGGSVYIESWAGSSIARNPQGMRTINSGAIDASGGNNRNLNIMPIWEGSAGEVMLYGPEGLTNSGAVTAVGGSDSGPSGAGSPGGWIFLTSEGSLSNTGSLDASGGDGKYRGGNANDIDLFGNGTVTNSGSLTARGGNADPNPYGSMGGDGGNVSIGLNVLPGSVSNTGAVTVTGGTGKTPGNPGYVDIQ